MTPNVEVTGGTRQDALPAWRRICTLSHAGKASWRLRLNDLLGRARTFALTDVGNRDAAAVSRRVHGDGKANQSVRARRADWLTARRSTLARNANHY